MLDCRGVLKGLLPADFKPFYIDLIGNEATAGNITFFLPARIFPKIADFAFFFVYFWIFNFWRENPKPLIGSNTRGYLLFIVTQLRETLIGRQSRAHHMRPNCGTLPLVESHVTSDVIGKQQIWERRHGGLDLIKCEFSTEYSSINGW